MPATRWSKARRPTPIAQRKTFCRAGGSDATFSSTRAYIFSYSRGVENMRVGRTSAMFAGTFSIDSA